MINLPNACPQLRRARNQLNCEPVHSNRQRRWARELLISAHAINENTRFEFVEFECKGDA